MLSSEENNPAANEEIKIVFAARVKRFYIFNALVLVLLGAGFYVASQAGYYRTGFFASTTLFLLWIFNADKLRLCPACGANPRGREGLASVPAVCAKCEIELH